MLLLRIIDVIMMCIYGMEYGVTKRLSLSLLDEQLAEVQRVAKKRGISVNGVLRQFIQIGLLVDSVQNTPGAKLIIRDGDEETLVVLV